MSDVRLVGTNPQDSSLVPVAVNSAGLLKTEVGKIELIDNDLTITGDLIVGGTINGEESGGGSGGGLPEPLGTEGQIIQVVEGEPAWVSNPSVPAMGVYDVTLITPEGGNTDRVGMYDGAGNAPAGLVNWDTYARDSAYWMEPSPPDMSMLRGTYAVTLNFQLNIQAESGKVLEIQTGAYAYCTQGKNNDWNFTVTVDNDNVIPISNTVSFTTGNCPLYTRTQKRATFLLNRPNIGVVDVTVQMVGDRMSWGDGGTAYCSGWQAIDASQYLIQRMLEARNQASTADLVNEVLGEVSPTTDIDRS
jgi:hypothetical protein